MPQTGALKRGNSSKSLPRRPRRSLWKFVEIDQIFNGPATPEVIARRRAIIWKQPFSQVVWRFKESCHKKFPKYELRQMLGSEDFYSGEIAFNSELIFKDKVIAISRCTVERDPYKKVKARLEFFQGKAPKSVMSEFERETGLKWNMAIANAHLEAAHDMGMHRFLLNKITLDKDYEQPVFAGEILLQSHGINTASARAAKVKGVRAHLERLYGSTRAKLKLKNLPSEWRYWGIEFR